MPIRIDAISAGYGRSTVLDDLSMDIPSGRITSVLGANGAGKTTLLRCLSGLIPVRSGTIDMDGQRLSNLQPPAVVAAGVAHVPEGRQLFAHLTVEQNLLLGRFAAASGGPSAAERLTLVFRYFPRVEQRRDQLAGTLSGGEQQMVAIGRALMSNPTVLLLDEPSMGLAPKLVQQVLAIVRQLNRDEGLTVILVEQNARLALGLADHVFVIETGCVVASGPPSSLQSDKIVRSFYLGRGDVA